MIKGQNRATACDVSTHASGHRPQRPSIGLPKCRAEKKKSKKILFFWLKSSDAAIHTGWRIFYVHVITLHTGFEKYLRHSNRHAFCVIFQSWSIQCTVCDVCVCINPSWARAQSKFFRAGSTVHFVKVPKYVQSGRKNRRLDTLVYLKFDIWVSKITRKLGLRQV